MYYRPAAGAFIIFSGNHLGLEDFQRKMEGGIELLLPSTYFHFLHYLELLTSYITKQQVLSMLHDYMDILLLFLNNKPYVKEYA